MIDNLGGHNQAIHSHDRAELWSASQDARMLQ
jgi:hypothetical protein